MAAQGVVDTIGGAGGATVNVGMVDGKYFYHKFFKKFLLLLASPMIRLIISPNIFARLAADSNAVV